MSRNTVNCRKNADGMAAASLPLVTAPGSNFLLLLPGTAASSSSWLRGPPQKLTPLKTQETRREVLGCSSRRAVLDTPFRELLRPRRGRETRARKCSRIQARLSSFAPFLSSFELL